MCAEPGQPKGHSRHSSPARFGMGEEEQRDREAEFQDLPSPSLLGRVGIWAVHQYQYWLGPIFGGQCRFYPTCSNYCILAIRKHGFWKGCLLTAWRLLRCQPLCKGGIDYP